MLATNEVRPYSAPRRQWDPFIKGFKVFKALGLPLKIKVTEGNKIVFEDHLRLLKFGFIIGNLNISLIPVSLIHFYQHFFFAYIVLLVMAACASGGLQWMLLSLRPVNDISDLMEKHGATSIAFVK